MVLVGERRQKILEVVSSGKAVTVEELSRILDVSPSTVRRDLRFLESRGLLYRTHGGACLLCYQATSRHWLRRKALWWKKKRP